MRGDSAAPEGSGATVERPIPKTKLSAQPDDIRWRGAPRPDGFSHKFEIGPAEHSRLNDKFPADINGGFATVLVFERDRSDQFLGCGGKFYRERPF